MRFRFTSTAAALLCATAVAVSPAVPAHADRVRDNQWHLKYLKVTQAHAVTIGAGVTVAVIDSGVSPHPDLRNNLLNGADFISGRGNGMQDRDGHGTAMAGLVAAHGQPDGSGALGIAPKAKIIPIKALPDTTGIDDGKVDPVADGIRLAIRRGATVVTMSISVPFSVDLSKAVQEAVAADIVIVAAAGNMPTDFGLEFPALAPGVLAIGAIDRRGSRAGFSVKGKKLGLVAPGVDIHSTSLGGKYQRSNGTSNAAAIVAGAAALVRSKFPELSAEEVVHRLTATATDKGPPGRDDEYGYGVLNLVAALTADVPPLASAASPGPTPTAKAQATPSLVAATPMPRREPAVGSATRLLVIAGLLVVVGMVVTLLVLRSRRQRPS